ncbi:MAG: Pesticin receptor [Verrucomicrobia subdivision 3 bacterium]|nr:Pesticin receptor [Limisphaerales bacterium]
MGKIQILASASVTALLLCQAAYAQTAEDGEEDTATRRSNSTTVTARKVEEIIVTARKVEETAGDVPMSITAATGETLTNRGITQPEDLTKITPGFAFQPGPYANPTFNLRGIGNIDDSFANSATVALYMDQAPIPYSAMGQGLAFDVERVEVLKGPQGTLFGQNSTGGAINFVANKSGDEFEAGIRSSYDNFEELELTGFIGGPISDTFGARVAFLSQTGGAWQKSVSRPGDELGDKDFLAVRGIFDWKPTDALSLSLNLNGWTNKNETQASQFIRFQPSTPAAAGFVAARYADVVAPGDDAQLADWIDTPLEHDDNMFQATLNGTYDLTETITLNSITAFADYEQFIIIDIGGTQRNSLTQRQQGTIETFSQEFRLNGTASDRLSWMLGASYQHDETETQALASLFGSNSFFPIFSSFIIDPVLGPIPTALNSVATEDPTEASVNGFNQQDIQTTGVFGNLDYELTDTLAGRVSIRYTETENDYNGCFKDSGNGAFAKAINESGPVNPGILSGACVTTITSTVPQTIGLVETDLDEDNVAFRIGLDWKPDADTLVYGNVTRGYKSGSFPNVPALFDFQNTPVRQEELVAYEVGFKKAFDTLNLEGAVFYYDYSDKQLAGRVNVGPPIGFLPAAVSAPEAKVTGAEFNVLWSPNEGLVLTFGATYLDAEIKSSQINSPTGLADASDAFGNTVNLAGTSFPTTSDLTLVGDIEYSFSVLESADAYVGASFSYRSDFFAQIADNPDFEIDGYTLIDLRAGLDFGNGLNVEVFGENVTDELYETTRIAQVDTFVRRLGRPAMYGVAVGFKF